MSQNITQQIQVVQRSEIGLKRTVNQDSVGVRVPQAGQASQHALFVVADGVGGNLPKGEVASHTAVEAMFAYYYAESDETDMLTRVGDALQDTNIAVRDQAMAEGVSAIGTTIVGLAVAPSGEAIGFNVGDSRLYRIRAGEIELISEDQVSLPEPGVLKDEFKARRVTKISSYIGQPNLLEPNFYRLKTQPGDTFLLCSDGVWSKIPDEELLQNVDRQPLDQASERLVKLVYERNAPDNLSVILIRLETPPAPRPAAAPIGEMPTSISPKSSAAPAGGGGSGRLVGGVVVVIVLIAAAAIALLSNQSSGTSSTPTDAALSVEASATSQPEKTIAAAETTEAAATDTSAPTTSAAATKATDTSAPTAANTATPRATATVTKTITPTTEPSRTPAPTLTETKSPTATPTVTATHTLTSTPTTAPTEVAAIIATDTLIPTASPTLKPSATHTPTTTPSDTPTPKPSLTSTPQPSNTPQPSATSQPTTTLNPTLITYTPTPTFTITPSLTSTLTFTPTATATYTDTPTATATFTDTPTNTPTLTPTPSPTFTPTNTLTPTLTFTPSSTPNPQQAAQTATAKARITPTAVPTLYAPHDDDVITLSTSVMFYPSTDSSSFKLPASGGVELPANTVVKVISSQSTPIDGLIYSYVTLQSKVEGVSSETGWTALAPAAQAVVTAHIQGGVAIRKGPGTVYERIGLGLKDGERAVVLGQATYRGQLWYYVDPENPQSLPGWIWSGVKGLVLEGNISNVPPKGFPPEPTATITPIPSETPTLTS